MRQRRIVTATLVLIALAAGVAAIADWHGSTSGVAATSTLSAKQLAQGLAAVLSGKPRKVFTYHVKLDRAASAVAEAVVRAEYEARNCSSSDALFVPPVSIGRGFSVVPNQCGDYAKDHFWFVGGTMHVVKNCSNAGNARPRYVVKTNECFRFKVVGKQRGLVGEGLLSYPWELMQMQLIRGHGRWLVASEDQTYLDNADGHTLWLRRVK